LHFDLPYTDPLREFSNYIIRQEGKKIVVWRSN
jgi:hypothetical protein